MAKCIYCNHTEDEFNDEHVIPQFLGGFTPLNPILKKSDGLVCKKCNSKSFSALETILKEDSEEGRFSQQLNLQGNGSVRVRGHRVKMNLNTGDPNSSLNSMFPFLKGVFTA
jgi:hypothetical protein